MRKRHCQRPSLIYFILLYFTRSSIEEVSLLIAKGKILTYWKRQQRSRGTVVAVAAVAEEHGARFPERAAATGGDCP